MLQKSHFDSRFYLKILRIIAIVFVTLFMSCNGNLYTDMSNKNTEEALLESALKAINSGDYDGAIVYLGKITSAYRHDAAVSKAAAAAYAGKCGLNFFNMVTTITSVTAATPLLLFMNAFTAVTVVPASCDSSQLEIETKYGTTSAARPADINLFLAILGIAKMGTYLRSIADPLQTGSVNASFVDACAVGTITDAQTKEVGTGLGLLLDNIASLTAAVAGNSAITSLAALQAACGAACVITDVNSANWTAGNIKLIRSAIKSNSFGIQNCANNPFVTCCP